MASDRNSTRDWTHMTYFAHERGAVKAADLPGCCFTSKAADSCPEVLSSSEKMRAQILSKFS
jgi:hypothetical protein